jgi:hypothetical protein
MSHLCESALLVRIALLFFDGNETRPPDCSHLFLLRFAADRFQIILAGNRLGVEKKTQILDIR